MNLYLKYVNFLDSVILKIFNDIKVIFPDKPKVAKVKKLLKKELIEKNYSENQKSVPNPIPTPSYPSKNLNVIYENQSGFGCYYTTSPSTTGACVNNVNAVTAISGCISISKKEFIGTDMSKYLKELYDNRGEDETYGDVMKANRILSDLDDIKPL